MELFDFVLRLVELMAWALNAAGTGAEIGASAVKGARWARSNEPLPPMPDPDALLEKAKARWRQQAAAEARDSRHFT
jgi:hypothetical protein